MRCFSTFYEITNHRTKQIMSKGKTSVAKLIKEKGETGRLHIETPLMGESLVSKEFLRRTEAKEYFRMQPDINVLKIGGQSIIDRGAKAVLPILDVSRSAALVKWRASFPSDIVPSLNPAPVRSFEFFTSSFQIWM